MENVAESKAEAESLNQTNSEPTKAPEVTTEAPKEISRRDALEVALIADKDPGLDVSYKGKRGREEAKIPEPKPEAPPVKVLHPPSEWDKSEKEDFYASTPRGQEAALRLDKSRKGVLEELRVRRAELQHLERLSQDVEPFLRAMGNKDPSPVAIQKALKMWDQFEKAEDPRLAAAEYLRAKGKADAIPEDWTASDAPTKQAQENATLQKELNEIKQRLARDDHQRALEPVIQTLSEFEGAKNAAGKPKYPSFRSDDTSEQGVKFGELFGSLVNGMTPFSKEFIARTQNRIPNLTKAQLLEEAYKFSGGVVDDSPAPRPQSTQKHLIQSSRAASSIPGNSSRSASHGAVKQYATRKEAIAAVLAEAREREG